MADQQTYGEQDLLVRIAKGDEQAYTTFFGQYHKRIYNYINQLTHHKEIAEELVLDVFLKLWEGRDILKEIKNIDGFLFRIAHNKSIDFLRQAKTNTQLSELAWENLANKENDDPASKVIKEQYEQLLRKAIQLLPVQRQKVFRMHHEEQRPYKEIAEELDISPNTVNMHMYEARRFIRQHLAKHMDLGILLLLLIKK